MQLYLARQLGAIWPLQLALAEQGRRGSPAPSLRRGRACRGPATSACATRRCTHLDEGGVFIAVGALHLPGRQGLVALLREAGYTVTAVE